MSLITKTFDQLVTDQVTAIQSKAISLMDFAIGSILRSIIESNSTVALWFQGLLLQILTITRASTSSGADLDSWAADYSFTRLAATYATGSVTFSRFSSTFSAFIPVGTQVQTADATPQVFAVTVDATNAYYSAGLGGYTIPAGTVSIAVPVKAVATGTAGNVLVGKLNTLTSSIPSVDTVSNTSAFSNALDAETDAALRARFVSYLGSLSRATKNAIGNAIMAVQQGLSYTLTENYNYSGTLTPGYFYAVIDDGSGNPSSTLLSSISNAIDTVRPFTSTFGVFAPVLLTANVALTITSTNHTVDAVLAQTAIQAYITGLTIGAPLPYTKLAQLAYDASPTITNVTAVTLNSATSDIAASAKQRIVAGTISIG